MHPDLYSPNIERRYAATIASSEQLARKWPRACCGAANAFLVLFGPSMGAARPDEHIEVGGANRPYRDLMRIGADIINFDGLRARKHRWNRLSAEILGNEKYISTLAAQINLDWSHSPDERNVHQRDLEGGFEEHIWPLFPLLQPRIICALTNRVWDIFFPQISAKPFNLPFTLTDSKGVNPSRHPHIFRFPNCDFDTLLLKPHRHPSRALSYEQCSIIGRVSATFLNESAEPFTSTCPDLLP